MELMQGADVTAFLYLSLLPQTPLKGFYTDIVFFKLRGEKRQTSIAAMNLLMNSAGCNATELP